MRAPLHSWGDLPIRLGRLLVLFPVLLALVPLTPSRAGADQDHPRHVKATEYAEGHALCPSKRLVIGRVPLRGGRCYVLVVVRDFEGAFLGFVDPAQKLPAGRLVRLDTPEGTRLRAHVLYLVPMPPQMIGQMLLVPPNTLQLVRLRREDDEEQEGPNAQGGQQTRVVASRLIVILTFAPLRDVSVTFDVQD